MLNALIATGLGTGVGRRVKLVPAPDIAALMFPNVLKRLFFFWLIKRERKSGLIFAPSESART